MILCVRLYRTCLNWSMSWLSCLDIDWPVGCADCMLHGHGLFGAWADALFFIFLRRYLLTKLGFVLSVA